MLFASLRCISFFTTSIIFIIIGASGHRTGIVGASGYSARKDLHADDEGGYSLVNDLDPDSMDAQSGNNLMRKEDAGPLGVPLKALAPDRQLMSSPPDMEFSTFLLTFPVGTEDTSRVRSKSPSTGNSKVKFLPAESEILMLLWAVLAFSIATTLLAIAIVWRKSPEPPPEEAVEEDLAPPVVGSLTSPAQIYCITTLNLAYGVMVATMGMFMLPKEAAHFFPNKASLAVGALQLFVAFSMLVGPLAGQVSDSFKHALGRRRPVILIGINMIVALTIGCWISSIAGCSSMFYICVLLQQIAWSSVYAAQSALLSDLVHPEKTGMASSFQIVNMLVGSMSGIMCFEGFAKSGIPHTYNYGVMVAICWLVLPVVLISAREARSDLLLLPARRELSIASLQSNFSFRDSRSPDFELLVKERCVYYVSVGSKVFILYFVRDVVGLSNPGDQAQVLAHAAVGTTVFASAGAGLASSLFSRALARPQTVAWAGSLVMAIGTGFWICPYFSDVETRKFILVFCTCVYGLGQGAYLSADLALTISTLPDPDEASRYIGLWGLSAFIGGGVGGAWMAMLMELFGHTLPQWFGVKLKLGSYYRHGYTMLLLSSFLCYLYIAYVCKSVRTRQEYELEQSSLNSPADEQSGADAASSSMKTASASSPDEVPRSNDDADASKAE